MTHQAAVLTPPLTVLKKDGVPRKRSIEPRRPVWKGMEVADKGAAVIGHPTPGPRRRETERGRVVHGRGGSRVSGRRQGDTGVRTPGGRGGLICGHHRDVLDPHFGVQGLGGRDRGRIKSQEFVATSVAAASCWQRSSPGARSPRTPPRKRPPKPWPARSPARAPPRLVRQEMIGWAAATAAAEPPPSTARRSATRYRFPLGCRAAHLGGQVGQRRRGGQSGRAGAGVHQPRDDFRGNCCSTICVPIPFCRFEFRCR